MLADNLFSALANHLRSHHYLVKEMEQDESEVLATNLTQISSTNLSAIVKSEKMVTSAYSYTGYYYYADILPQSNNKTTDNFASLLQTLEQQPHSYISFQLMPIQMQSQEEYAIRDLSNGMKPLVQGVFSRGETIQEPYATVPYQCYDYYTQRIRHPIFLYNIIAASLHAIQPLAAQITAFLQGTTASQVSFECLSVNPAQRICFDFDLFPWQLNNLLQQHYRNPTIWSGGVVAPINLSRLPFWVTAEEAITFFRLPVDDGTITGIINNMIADSTELLQESVVDGDNIQFGVQKSRPTVTVGAPEKAFTQHATIVGVPGTGKTTFALNLLLQFNRKNIPFLAIEPTKKEYRALLKAIPNLQVFTPGNNTVSPFILNPFIPPKGVTVEQSCSQS